MNTSVHNSENRTVLECISDCVFVHLAFLFYLHVAPAYIFSFRPTLFFQHSPAHWV